MILSYRTKPSGFTGEGQIKELSWWDKDFCCDKMKKMWEEKRRGEGRIGVDETGLTVHKDEAVSLHFTDCHEDDTDHIDVPISYCPFCGVKIKKARI